MQNFTLECIPLSQMLSISIQVLEPSPQSRVRFRNTTQQTRNPNIMYNIRGCSKLFLQLMHASYVYHHNRIFITSQEAEYRNTYQCNSNLSMNPLWWENLHNKNRITANTRSTISQVPPKGFVTTLKLRRAISVKTIIALCIIQSIFL